MKRIFLTCLLAAVEYSLFSQMAVSVAEIKSSNLQFNKPVFISGRVTEVDKISSSACKYMLQDSQGDKILVSSVHGCPDLNKVYTVKGTAARDDVSFLMYFKEEERKLQSAPPPPEEVEYIELQIVDDEAEEIDIKYDEDSEMEPMGSGEDNDAYEEAEEEVFIIVEDMPKFQGGDQSKFRGYIAQNLHYPDSASAKGISGRVFVQFVVNSEGNIVNAKIVRGVDPYLDAEALRVVNSSPRWEPGKQRGKPVSVQFTFPIAFILQ
jgi:protein TonB